MGYRAVDLGGRDQRSGRLLGPGAETDRMRHSHLRILDEHGGGRNHR